MSFIKEKPGTVEVIKPNKVETLVGARPSDSPAPVKDNSASVLFPTQPAAPSAPFKAPSMPASSMAPTTVVPILSPAAEPGQNVQSQNPGSGAQPVK